MLIKSNTDLKKLYVLTPEYFDELQQQTKNFNLDSFDSLDKILFKIILNKSLNSYQKWYYYREALINFYKKNSAFYNTSALSSINYESDVSEAQKHTETPEAIPSTVENNLKHLRENNQSLEIPTTQVDTLGAKPKKNKLPNHHDRIRKDHIVKKKLRFDLNRSLRNQIEGSENNELRFDLNRSLRNQIEDSENNVLDESYFLAKSSPFRSIFSPSRASLSGSEKPIESRTSDFIKDFISDPDLEVELHKEAQELLEARNPQDVIKDKNSLGLFQRTFIHKPTEQIVHVDVLPHLKKLYPEEYEQYVNQINDNNFKNNPEPMDISIFGGRGSNRLSGLEPLEMTNLEANIENDNVGTQEIIGVTPPYYGLRNRAVKRRLSDNLRQIRKLLQQDRKKQKNDKPLTPKEGRLQKLVHDVIREDIPRILKEKQEKKLELQRKFITPYRRTWKEGHFRKYSELKRARLNQLQLRMEKKQEATLKEKQKNLNEPEWENVLD